MQKSSLHKIYIQINEQNFIKNIKRMFITKKMEDLNIEEVNIKFDNSTKSFKINIKKDKYLFMKGNTK
jgi:hypothetical protein